MLHTERKIHTEAPSAIVWEAHTSGICHCSVDSQAVWQYTLAGFAEPDKLIANGAGFLAARRRDEIVR